jgi:hypothetical protein
MVLAAGAGDDRTCDGARMNATHWHVRLNIRDGSTAHAVRYQPPQRRAFLRQQGVADAEVGPACDCATPDQAPRVTVPV